MGRDGRDTPPRFLSGGRLYAMPLRIWLILARIVKYFLNIPGDLVTNLLKIYFLYKPTGVFNAHWRFKLVVHTVR